MFPPPLVSTYLQTVSGSWIGICISCSIGVTDSVRGGKSSHHTGNGISCFCFRINIDKLTLPSSVRPPAQLDWVSLIITSLPQIVNARAVFSFNFNQILMFNSQNRRCFGNRRGTQDCFKIKQTYFFVLFCTGDTDKIWCKYVQMKSVKMMKLPRIMLLLENIFNIGERR